MLRKWNFYQKLWNGFDNWNYTFPSHHHRLIWEYFQKEYQMLLSKSIQLKVHRISVHDLGTASVFATNNLTRVCSEFKSSCRLNIVSSITIKRIQSMGRTVINQYTEPTVLLYTPSLPNILCFFSHDPLPWVSITVSHLPNTHPVSTAPQHLPILVKTRQNKTFPTFLTHSMTVSQHWYLPSHYWWKNIKQHLTMRRKVRKRCWVETYNKRHELSLNNGSVLFFENFTEWIITILHSSGG